VRTIISGLAVVLSALAQGQNNGEHAMDKVLSFNGTDNRTVMQEICNAIRAITGWLWRPGYSPSWRPMPTQP
jgi:hypothetical protein